MNDGTHDLLEIRRQQDAFLHNVHISRGVRGHVVLELRRDNAIVTVLLSPDRARLLADLLARAARPESEQPEPA